MSSIAVFRMPIRFVLGDNNSDATLFSYPDDSIDEAVRTVLFFGKMKGFSISPSDNTMITPDVVDPNRCALLSYHAAKLFVDPMPSRYSFKTRAQSESIGDFKGLVATLESEIYRLENGTMFTGWMNYFNWISGMSGLPLGQVLTQLNVNNPIYSQNFSLDSFPVPIDEVFGF